MRSSRNSKYPPLFFALYFAPFFAVFLAKKIDIFDGDQQNIGGQRPSVIISKTLSKIGSFEIDLPKSDTQLWIGAYIDEDEDGRPGPQDPSGWYTSNPISASKDHSGITVNLNVPDAPTPK